MSYAGNGKVIQRIRRPPPSRRVTTLRKRNCGCGCNGHCDGKAKKAGANGEAVDFTKMTPAQKVAYHKTHWDRILG